MTGLDSVLKVALYLTVQGDFKMPRDPFTVDIMLRSLYPTWATLRAQVDALEPVVPEQAPASIDPVDPVYTELMTLGELRGRRELEIRRSGERLPSAVRDIMGFYPAGRYVGRVTSARAEGDRVHTEMELSRAVEAMTRTPNEDGVDVTAFRDLEVTVTPVTPPRRNRGPRQYRPAPGCKAFP